MEAEGGLLRAQDFLALLAFVIRVEDKAALIGILQKHHADIGQALLIDGGERHAVGIIGFGFFRVGQPIGKDLKGIVALGKTVGGGEGCQIVQAHCFNQTFSEFDMAPDSSQFIPLWPRDALISCLDG